MTMIDYDAETNKINQESANQYKGVVRDEIHNPAYCAAKAIRHLSYICIGRRKDETGVHHFTVSSRTSWKSLMDAVCMAFR